MIHTRAEGGSSRSAGIESHLPPGPTSAQLFDGTTGGLAINSTCNPMMFSGQIRQQYSEEEQIHLIRVLLRFQIRNFRQLLVRMGDIVQAAGSTARRSKVLFMVTRLEEASAAIDVALQMVLQSFAPV